MARSVRSLLEAPELRSFHGGSFGELPVTLEPEMEFTGAICEGSHQGRGGGGIYIGAPKAHCRLEPFVGQAVLVGFAE